MLLRAWEVLELQVAGNEENIQQANIFVFLYSHLRLAVVKNTILG